MDPIKIQFIHVHEQPADLSKQAGSALTRFLGTIIPQYHTLSDDQVSAALSLDIEGLVHMINARHPEDTVQFRHVQFERITGQGASTIRVTLSSELFSIISEPVCRGKKITFIGIEGGSDRLRSYAMTLKRKTTYHLSNNITRSGILGLLRSAG
jgi:hypothetical protein